MPSAATWLDPEIVILSEVSKNGTGKDHMIDISYRWNLRYDKKELTYETETDSWTWRTDW